MLKYTIREIDTGYFVRSVDLYEAKAFHEQYPNEYHAVFVETPTGGPRRVLMWRGIQPWVASSTGMPEPM